MIDKLFKKTPDETKFYNKDSFVLTLGSEMFRDHDEMIHILKDIRGLLEEEKIILNKINKKIDYTNEI